MLFQKSGRPPHRWGLVGQLGSDLTVSCLFFNVLPDPKLLKLQVSNCPSLQVGVLVLSLLLEPLEGAMASAHRSFSHQMAAVLRWFVDWRVLCLSGFALYSLVSLTFMFGEFNKVSATSWSGVRRCACQCQWRSSRRGDRTC